MDNILSELHAQKIVTREGIRNTVKWNEIGFQYVGDAPDGEAALPLIMEARPDIVITDIRMPFMDGLELAQVLRRELPGLKIIILSGHDEFEYAQRAIPLEVSSYQLKPVTRQELTNALLQAAAQLDVERQEKATHLELIEKSNAYHELLQEKFMLRLVTGGLDTAEALAQSELTKAESIPPLNPTTTPLHLKRLNTCSLIKC